MYSRLCKALLLSITLISGALAQPASPPVRVATFALPPFVVEQQGSLTGFSIDLWKAIAAKMNVNSRYQMAHDVKDVFDDLRSGKADVAVSGLFYTTERDLEFDFSYPIMEVGLRVMVLDTGKPATPRPLRDLLNLVFSRVSVYWLGAALLIVVAAAHLMWFVQRWQGNNATGSTLKYFPGIFRMMYWAATTLMTQGDEPPPHWLARMLAVLWMFVGIVFVAFYTAQLTTTLTVEQIQGVVNGPDDLPGKRSPHYTVVPPSAISGNTMLRCANSPTSAMSIWHCSMVTWMPWCWARRAWITVQPMKERDWCGWRAQTSTRTMWALYFR